MTLYWLFLFGITTGERFEEIGQAKAADVKTDDAFTYIDIDDYAAADDQDKSIKTGTSRRLVPIHSNLLRLGFDSYLKALIAANHTRLFPDLISNQIGKRTKEASRIANRISTATSPRMLGSSFTSFDMVSKIWRLKQVSQKESSIRYVAMRRRPSAANTSKAFA